ncbi:MAG: hypothetical protein AB1813_25590 [Verrucomicrobiota bacterium]|jgi:hypothetical protein
MKTPLLALLGMLLAGCATVDQGEESAAKKYRRDLQDAAILYPRSVERDSTYPGDPPGPGDGRK